MSVRRLPVNINPKDVDDTIPILEVSSKSQSVKAKTRRITVEPIMFLAFMGIGTIGTIRAEYLQQRIARDKYNYTFPSEANQSCGIANTSDPDSDTQAQIQHDTANWSLYISICSTLPSIFSSIVIGKLSDIKGRKLALFLSVLGMLFQSSVYLIIITLNLPMRLFYIGDIVYGVTGGSPVLTSVSLAYIADVTTIQQRTFRVVIVETVLIVSIGVTQLALGFLISATGFIPPFGLLIACQIVAIIYIIVPGVLYESIAEKHGGHGFRDQIYRLFRGMFDLFVLNEDNRRWRLALLCAMFIPIITVIYGYTGTITLYVIGEPFCWSSVEVGIYSGISLAIFSTSNIIGSKLLGLCLSDIWILHIGLASSVASMVALGLASDTLFVYLSAVIGCVRALPLAITRSMASKSVSANEQGVTFSVLAALDALGAFVGPLLLQLLYSVNVLHGQPGVPFFAAAGLSALAEVIALMLHLGFLTISGKIKVSGSQRTITAQC